MRIALLSPRDPVPIYSGLLERVYQTCRFLGRDHEVNVYFPYEPQRKASESGRVPDEQPFTRIGLQSSVINLLERTIPEYSPLRAPYHTHPWLYWKVRSGLREFNPDALIVEFPYLVPLAKAASRGVNCTVILSEHNVEYEFARRLDIPLWQVLRQFEVFACNHVDAVFAVSETDRDLLAQHLRDDVVLGVSPNGVDVNRYSPDRRQNAGSIRSQYGLSEPVFVFHGELGNAQNAQVVKLLHEEVFPAIREEFETASLLLVGSSPPEETPKGVAATGLVDDLPSHIAAADVALAPMLSGSGTNLKILEYLATGLPVVTTPVGAEGLSLSHERDALVVEADEVAAQTIRLLGDEELRGTLSTNARERAVSDFSWENTLAPYERVLQQQQQRRS